MALFAITDETGFEGGFDAGDDTLVDIRFTLLAAGGFDIDVDQFLAIDDRYAQLFLLRSVKQHTFHLFTPRPVGRFMPPMRTGRRRYRDVRGEGSVGGGMPGSWHGIAGHRAQMVSNVIAERTNGLVDPGGPMGRHGVWQAVRYQPDRSDGATGVRIRRISALIGSPVDTCGNLQLLA